MLGDVPDNVWVQAFVPQLALLDHVDLLVDGHAAGSISMAAYTLGMAIPVLLAWGERRLEAETGEAADRLVTGWVTAGVLGGVAVGSALALRGLWFDTVILADLSAGAFPRTVRQDRLP